MNSDNNFSNIFVGALAIIGAIAGTILWVSCVFGEWYADFDLEPTGIITGILAIIVFLLPFAISLLVGGGSGLLLGGLIGMAIELIVVSIRTFTINKINSAQKRKETRIASATIRRTNKSINEDIERLRLLKKQIKSKPEMVVANHNLCQLISLVSNANIGFDACVNYCANQYALLSEVRLLEKKIFDLASEYEKVGDINKAEHYRNIVNY